MSAQSPSTAVLRRMLAPWLTRAKGRVVLSLADLSNAADFGHDLWIEWHVPEDGTFDVEDVEAMQLLELLARVDNSAGWTTILEIKDLQLYLDRVVDTNRGTPLYPRYSIHGMAAVFAKSPENFQSITKLLLFEIDPTDHTPAFYGARETLLHCWMDRHNAAKRPSAMRIPWTLNLDMAVFNDTVDAASVMLDHITRSVAVAQDPTLLELFPPTGPSTSTVAASQVFVLHGLGIDFDWELVTDAMLCATQAITTHWNVATKSIQFRAARFAPDRLSPRTTVPYFRTMLLEQQPPHKTKPSSLILLHDVAIGVFQAAMSALLTNRSVRFFEMSLPNRGVNRNQNLEGDQQNSPPDHRLFWPWIAYAIFSAEASSALEIVELNLCGLTDMHVFAFENVLLAHDPLAGVPVFAEGPYTAPSSERLLRVPLVVDIGPGTEMLLPIGSEDRKIEKLKTGDHVEALRVVDDSPGRRHIAVVYPGAGVCWVSRDQVIAQRHYELSPRSRLSLRRLGLVVNETTSLQALQRLITRVGSHLEMLSIETPENELLFLDDAVFQTIFESCPRLRHVELNGLNVANFEWLFEHGSSLRSLRLAVVDTVDPDGYEKMIVALTKQRTTLVELDFECTSVATYSHLLLEMLDSNQYFERLVLRTTGDQADEFPPEMLEALFARNGKPLSAQRAPLSVDCKLAFLSVMKPATMRSLQSSSDTKASASKRQCRARWLPELDTTLLHHIFELAAFHKVRVCGFI